jgi:hypothetical protein
MRPSATQEAPATAPQIWSPLLMNCELICLGASFGVVSTLMAIEVWKRVFGMLSPRAP